MYQLFLFLIGIIAKKFLKYTSHKRNILRSRRAIFRLSGLNKSKPNSNGPDEQLTKKKNEFIQSLTISEQAKQKLEFETRNQADSQIWLNERRNRLTASNFGRICKMRPNTSCKNNVFDILYGNTKTRAMEYGNKFEGLAITTLENIIKKPIKKCGLFIDDDVPYLAATPGNLLIYNTTIINVALLPRNMFIT